MKVATMLSVGYALHFSGWLAGSLSGCMLCVLRWTLVEFSVGSLELHSAYPRLFILNAHAVV
jgi:hypothetical protein